MGYHGLTRTPHMCHHFSNEPGEIVLFCGQKVLVSIPDYSTEVLVAHEEIHPISPGTLVKLVSSNGQFGNLKYGSLVCCCVVCFVIWRFDPEWCCHFEVIFVDRYYMNLSDDSYVNNHNNIYIYIYIVLYCIPNRHILWSQCVSLSVFCVLERTTNTVLKCTKEPRWGHWKTRTRKRFSTKTLASETHVIFKAWGFFTVKLAKQAARFAQVDCASFSGTYSVPASFLRAPRFDGLDVAMASGHSWTEAVEHLVTFVMPGLPKEPVSRAKIKQNSCSSHWLVERYDFPAFFLFFFGGCTALQEEFWVHFPFKFQMAESKLQMHEAGTWKSLFKLMAKRLGGRFLRWTKNQTSCGHGRWQSGLS